MTNIKTNKIVSLTIAFVMVFCSLSSVCLTVQVAAGDFGTGTYRVNTSSGADVIVRSGAGTSYPGVSSLSNGAVFEVTETSNGWGYVTRKGGWVLLDYAVFQTNMTGLAEIKDGWYKIASVLDESKIIDQQYASGSNGGKIVLQGDNGGTNQIVYIERLSNGAYRFKFKHSGLYFEMPNNSCTVGEQVQQWEWQDGYFCKQWYIKETSKGYIIINKLSGMALNVWGASTADGTAIVQYPVDENDAAEIFKLVEVSAQSQTKQTLTNELYKINISSSYISCSFDGYRTTSGRHEGIDFTYGISKLVHSLTNGVITRVTYGSTGSNGLSTIAIYDDTTNKTVIYLHTAPLSTLSVGQQINKGQQIAIESWRGVSSSSSAHTHVEVRDGRQTSASKSVGDPILDNSNPTAFWNAQGYEVK